LPRDVAERAYLHEGQEIVIELDGDVLTMRKCLPQHRLEDLLAGVTDDNLHEETDWGEPIGKEVW
jgi:antitoxin MazE